MIGMQCPTCRHFRYDSAEPLTVMPSRMASRATS
jgi:hypothetical protein